MTTINKTGIRVCLSPTGTFTILEPQNQEIGEFYVVHERRVMDFDARKLIKVWSGRGRLLAEETFFFKYSRPNLSKLV